MPYVTRNSSGLSRAMRAPARVYLSAANDYAYAPRVTWREQGMAFLGALIGAAWAASAGYSLVVTVLG